MQEHSHVADEVKASRAAKMLQTLTSKFSLKTKRFGPRIRAPRKTWRDDLTPRQYAEGAITCLEDQLTTAKSPSRIKKLQMGIRRWELALEKL